MDEMLYHFECFSIAHDTKALQRCLDNPTPPYADLTHAQIAVSSTRFDTHCLTQNMPIQIQGLERFHVLRFLVEIMLFRPIAAYSWVDPVFNLG